jgi:hypothetical protein
LATDTLILGESPAEKDPFNQTNGAGSVPAAMPVINGYNPSYPADMNPQVDDVAKGNIICAKTAFSTFPHGLH